MSNTTECLSARHRYTAWMSNSIECFSPIQYQSIHQVWLHISGTDAIKWNTIYNSV